MTPEPKSARSSTQPKHKRDLEQDKIIGRLIAERRRKARLSQRDLARLLRRPHSYVANVESGQHRLDIVELLGFADALGFRASRFVDQVQQTINKDWLAGDSGF